jgi:hypothetical protein
MIIYRAKPKNKEKKGHFLVAYRDACLDVLYADETVCLNLVNKTAEQNYNIKMGNTVFGNGAYCKYLEMGLTASIWK